MAGMRNMLAQNQSVQNAQGSSLYVLGWIAQMLAFLAGSYARNSWPGHSIRWVFNLVPWDDFTRAVLILWFVGWAVDILWDLVPNQTAVTFGIMGPVLSVGQSGDIAGHLNEWSGALQDAIGGKVESLTGNLGVGTMAVICGAVAVIVGKRVLSKKGSAAGGGR